MLKLEYAPTREEILKEAGGNEQLLEELSEKLRLWLNQQLHLPQNISDRQLKRFVYTTKFNFEKAKKCLDLYYSIRNWIPEVFADFDPSGHSINQFFKFMQVISIPKLTPEGYRLLIWRFTNADISMFDIWAVLKYSLMINEMCLKENITDNSIVVAVDLKNLHIKIAEKLTLSFLKKFLIVLEASGARVKNIYAFNAPTYTDMIMKILKTIMKPKLLQRISIFASGVESLYEKIPRSLFPSDYGGDQPSMDTLTKMWHAHLVEQRNWFLQHNELKTDESRRSESSIINPNDLFGISGTFRKLDID